MQSENTKLTFLIFSRNDNPDEQFRVSLSLESLIDQDCKEPYKILFYDLSDKGKEFVVPQSPKLNVVYFPIPFGRDFYPSFVRNNQAIAADTPLVCFTNADCIYARNFATCVIEALNRGEHKLVMCERRNARKEEMGPLVSLNACREFLKKCTVTGGSHACGECQGVHRKIFISLGGYHGLIKAGGKEVHRGDWFSQGWGEDSYLADSNSLGFQHEWISEKTRLLHLHHYQRDNAIFRNKERAKG